MDHDQLFKELLQAFFREFMELFFSDVAMRLDFDRVTFLNQEAFTDTPVGERRNSDFVAKVYTHEGLPELILTHIEVEARRESSFPERMFEYYMLLKLRERLPIYPIVIYLSPGAGGLVTEQHAETLFGEEINVFRYKAVGLPDLNADDYQELDNPLGPALSALMKTSRLGKVAQKYQCLRAMATSQIDDARKALLTNIVDSYLRLNPHEADEFEQLIVDPNEQEVGEMISVYEQRGIDKGVLQGVVRGKRDSLLRQLRLRFGEIPKPMQSHLEAISDIDVLDLMTDRIITAKCLDDMALAEN